MDKQIRYVHGVNPITGVQCTNRIVVTGEDVTLWQVDRVLDTEEMFDAVDSGEVGMVCFSHNDFGEVIDAYLGLRAEMVLSGKPEEAEQAQLESEGLEAERAEHEAREEEFEEREREAGV